MFTDEARFGRMNRIRPCWAPVGMRPEVAAQLIREYIYLYGAVSPKDGTCVYLIMPTSNTASFQAFLDVLARKFARQDILLVLDGAPNHRCGHLIVPDNITLLYLPPYSPGSIRKKISGMKSAKKSSRTMHSNPWTPCAPSSSRPSSISSETPSSFAPLPASPISSTHSDVEMVLEATSRTICAPMFSNLFSSSISLATVTPSLVTRGAPNDLSSTTFRPLGPRVTRTASARMSIPWIILSRASTENFTSLAAMSYP